MANVGQVTVQQVQADAALECDRVVVVIDARINATVESGIEVKPFGDVLHSLNSGIIERDTEVEDVAVRIENVCAWIDGFRAFQRDKFSYLKIRAARREDR